MDNFNRNQEIDYYASNAYENANANGLISRRTFNLIMGLTVIYGIVLNIVMCKYCFALAMSINPIVLMIGYLICGIVGVMIAQKSDNPVISFVGYNLLVVPLGLILSIIIASYGGIDSPIVMKAFMLTLEITAIMVVAAVLFPNFFARIGGFLFVALIALFVVSIVEMFLRSNSLFVSYIAAIIFSLYIGYDIYRAQRTSSTVDHAIDAALSVYLDIINLFMRILSITGSKSRD